jgi:glycosyltransferase involved in cell wall biosynthesis
LNVLYVANVSDLYGASRSLLRLAGRVAGEGHQVDVVLPADGPLGRRLEEAGVTVAIHAGLPILTRRGLRSPLGWPGLCWRLLTSTIRLAALVRARRTDVIHTNSAVVLSACLAARLCGKPHVWHMREFFADISRVWLLYQWFMYSFSAAIVCNSEAVAGQFSAFIRKRKLAVVYNGIPAQESLPPALDRVAAVKRKYGLTGSPLVGVIGRVNLDQKGQDVFVRAAARLAPDYPEARFAIVGSAYPGNEEHSIRLRALVEELGLRERVIFTGEVQDMMALHAALDIVVLPARKPEGLGNVLIEAMALARPVVGSAIGGIPEVIADGVNGFLAAANDVDSLAGALGKLLRDPELRRRMGEEGRRRFEARFEFDRCYDRVWSIYQSVLNRGLKKECCDVAGLSR